MKMTKGIIAALALLLAACTASAPKVKDDTPPPRWKIAEAMFQERCKKSGEFIHRTVAGVEGIYLLKLRPEAINYGHTKEQQFQMDDPYGRDLGGDGYIQSFVRGFETRQAQFPPGAPNRFGYRYVEAIDPKDGNRYRYTGAFRDVSHVSSILIGGDGKTYTHKEFVLDKIPAPGAPPLYGVTYEDLSTHEEREYWIAGSSLKVIDLKTNEVIAERIGYMWDPGQGANSGGRAPWLMAANHACPGFQRNPNFPIQPGHGASAQQIQTEDFVEKILKPILEK